MNQLKIPVLLAGPIIRRVEPSQVYIWAATSEAYHIDANLYDVSSERNNITYEEINIQCELNTIQLGKKLFIQLLKITPGQGLFNTNQLIGYNLTFKKGARLFDLASLGLLTKGDENSICYGELKYPSFYISDSKAPILYGSCRKLHGEGKDTLSLGDQVVNDHYDDTLNRPGALFLLGDQIYADDVADPLVRPISTLAKHLIGHKEQLGQLESGLDHAMFQTALKQINGRGYIMKYYGKFTSSSASNHLIELGEYAIMYLLSWSPALWELIIQNRLIDSFDEALKKNDVYFVFSSEYKKKHKAEKKQRSKQYRKQQERLTSFYRSLYRVRRLLANIPVYMIFDDHDITDDWNLSYEWKENVKKAPLGKHVVSNGLTAYWAFQGWGNNPDSFNRSFITTIKRYAEALMNGKMQKAYQAWTEQMWGFKQWHFVAPTSPKAVFLDTRTQRKFDHCPKPYRVGKFFEETESVPQLICKREWEAVNRSLMKSDWKSNQPLIIVSAVPVYGMELIENFLHKYTKPLRIINADVDTTFDFEAWKYNGRGFTAFLQQVADWNPSTCIILSGDVHYSSSVYAKVQMQNGQELNIKEFTSSPQNNMSFPGIWGHLLKMIIRMKSKPRHKEDVYRICDADGRIKQIKRKEMNQVQYVWKDQLSYQPVKNKSIVETENNIGYLKVVKQDIEHQLLTILRH